MAISKSVLGLQKALRVHTGEGDYTVDPSHDPTGYGNLLGRSYDARMAENRAVEDATPLEAGIDPAQNAYFKTFNRGQESAAMGPAGFNRNWAGFFEAPRVLEENNPGTKYRIDAGSLNLPTEQYGSPDASGALQRVGTVAPRGSLAEDLATQSLKKKTREAMPESHEDFMARMAKHYGPLGRK